MEQQAPFNVVNWLYCKALVEPGSSLVIFQEQALVYPEQDEEENASNRVKNRQPRAVHQARPQVSKNLGIDIVAGDLRASVERLQVWLQLLLCVALVVFLVIWSFLYSAATWSVTASFWEIQTWPEKSTGMRRKDIDEQRETKSFADVLVPLYRKIIITSVQNRDEA